MLAQTMTFKKCKVDVEPEKSTNLPNIEWTFILFDTNLFDPSNIEELEHLMLVDTVRSTNSVPVLCDFIRMEAMNALRLVNVGKWIHDFDSKSSYVGVCLSTTFESAEASRRALDYLTAGERNLIIKVYGAERNEQRNVFAGWSTGKNPARDTALLATACILRALGYKVRVLSHDGRVCDAITLLGLQ